MQLISLHRARSLLHTDYKVVICTIFQKNVNYLITETHLDNGCTGVLNFCVQQRYVDSVVNSELIFVLELPELCRIN